MPSPQRSRAVFVSDVDGVLKSAGNQSMDADDDDDEYSTYEQRVGYLKQYQAVHYHPPTHAELQVFLVCDENCSLRKEVKEEHERLLRVGVKLEVVTLDWNHVRLNDPPIPIIGTDVRHRRLVRARQVDEFVTHVNMWRKVFHSGGGAGVFIDCQMKNAAEVVRLMRSDTWFRNVSEGGTMGRDTWDMLIIGGDVGDKLSTPISRYSTLSERLGDDILAYAVSKRGADRLLAYARAYTVPTVEFLRIVGKRDISIYRWSGWKQTKSCECEKQDGEVKESTALPFYPPVHWLHAASQEVI